MGYLGGFSSRSVSGANGASRECEGRRWRGRCAHGRHAQPLRGRHGEAHRLRAVCRCLSRQVIYVRSADNLPPTRTRRAVRFVYEINYLRRIHCDLCVEACPTEAITESKLFEFSFTNRSDAIYTKAELVVGDDGLPQQLPWEDWTDLATVAAKSSAWVRATAPGGSAAYEGRVGWSGELGFGVGRNWARPHRPDADDPAPTVVVTDDMERRFSSPSSLAGAISVIAPQPGPLGAQPGICSACRAPSPWGQFLAAVQVIVYAGAIVVCSSS